MAMVALLRPGSQIDSHSSAVGMAAFTWLAVPDTMLIADLRVTAFEMRKAPAVATTARMARSCMLEDRLNVREGDTAAASGERICGTKKKKLSSEPQRRYYDTTSSAMLVTTPLLLTLDPAVLPAASAVAYLLYSSREAVKDATAKSAAAASSPLRHILRK